MNKFDPNSWSDTIKIFGNYDASTQSFGFGADRKYGKGVKFETSQDDTAEINKESYAALLNKTKLVNLIGEQSWKSTQTKFRKGDSFKAKFMDFGEENITMTVSDPNKASIPEDDKVIDLAKLMQRSEARQVASQKDIDDYNTSINRAENNHLSYNHIPDYSYTSYMQMTGDRTDEYEKGISHKIVKKQSAISKDKIKQLHCAANEGRNVRMTATLMDEDDDDSAIISRQTELAVDEDNAISARDKIVNRFK